jgi:hypothetical protein
MSTVKNLESTKSTNSDLSIIANPTEADNKSEGFFAGHVGFSAGMSFHFNSPWKAVGKWLKKVAATIA